MNEVIIQENTLIDIIAKASKDPTVDVAKLEKLLDVQERILNKQAEIAFNSAMAELQPLLPAIAKNGRIEFTDKNNVARSTPFATYDAIDAIIRPLYTKFGFSISFDTKWGADGVTVFGTLSHKDGHSKTSEMRLPLDTSGSKNNLQAMGSTLSYGKRYLLGLLLNIVTKDDDDGKHADEAISIEQAAALDIRLRKFDEAYRKKFLSYMKVGQINEITVRDFKKADVALTAKETAK